jgi:hypothetical protein
MSVDIAELLAPRRTHSQVIKNAITTAVALAVASAVALVAVAVILEGDAADGENDDHEDRLHNPRLHDRRPRALYHVTTTLLLLAHGPPHRTIAELLSAWEKSC